MLCVTVIVAIAIATQLAEGVTMIVLAIGIGAAIASLLRLSLYCWQRMTDHSHERRA